MTILSVFPCTIWIVVYMVVAFLVNPDMNGPAGYIFLALCVIVLFLEFFKSEDIKVFPYIIDIISSVVGLIIVTVLLSYLVFSEHHAPTFFHWFGFAILVGDAILSPFNSFRTAWRYMEVSGYGMF